MAAALRSRSLITPLYTKNVGLQEKRKLNYFNDKKNGLGTFTWESGNIYHGNYINDERMGYGEMYWTDGSIYKGEWKKGI